MTDISLPLVPLGSDPARAQRPALRMDGVSLSHGQLATAAAEVAGHLSSFADQSRVVAVPALPRVETVVAILGALRAGIPVVPLNTGAGQTEVAHVVADCQPAAVLCAPATELPGPLAAVSRVEIHCTTAPSSDPVDHTQSGVVSSGPGPDDPALVVYTSGTTGLPKGVVLSHRALAHDLDALAAAWQLGPEDVLVQALPLFHVHGLVLGILGPLRVGASVRHLGRFDASAVVTEFDRGASVFYGVPTMYHRLADLMDADPDQARSLGRARLLISGSAGLPAHDRLRVEAATGTPVLERYGMTETLITCAMTIDGGHAPGTVGPPVSGVSLRLVDDHRRVIQPDDRSTVGEIEVKGPTLFSGYLGRPDATRACFTEDGWFRTGDLATWADGGAVKISGRASVDLIKTGGYRVGAGEVENALLSHPEVAEAAVTAEPDDDLGERIVAWVVPVADRSPSADDLINHVADQLSHHKRPRVVRFITSLPRNALGKVLKNSLTPPAG